MLLSLLLAVFLQAPTGPGDIAGLVVDQQRLPVARVEVVLVCDGDVQSIATDRLGAFSFHPPSGFTGGCQVAVRHPGFRPVTRNVPPGEGPLRIELEIDRLTDAVAVRGARQPFLTTTLSERDFRTIGATTQQVLDYARALAGAANLPTAIYVDGLPSTTLPPLHLIERVEVNSNPFSAEFADGDMTTLRLFTRPPARSFRMNATGDFLSFGGREVLLPDARSDVDSWTLGGRGPVPGLPMTFAANVSRSRSRLVSPIRAVIPDGTTDASVTSVDTTTTSSLDVYLVRPQSRTTVSYRSGVTGRSNAGAGGLTLADATSSSTFDSHDLRGTFNLATPHLLVESGMLLSASTAATRANSAGQQVSVGGAFIGGGAPILATDTRRLQWSARGIVRSPSRRAWTAGAIVSGSRYEDDQQPNPLGFIYFESPDQYRAARAGSATGTLFLTRGSGLVTVPSAAVAPFVEMVVAQSASTQLTTGIRAEYQSGFGTLWSPRLWFAARWRSFNLSAGGGVFPRSVPEFVQINVATRDGQHLRQYLLPDAPLGTAPELPESIPEIQSRFEPGATRPREFVERLSASRPFGSALAAVEFTWTQGRHLLGASRVGDETWVDVIESNRSLSRQRLHVQLQHGWRLYRVVGNYEWVRSHDNTDGPLAFAATSDLAAEWARSTGVAAHNASGVVSLNLPQGVTVNLTDTWHGSAPFNITSARDVSDAGLFVSRGGRPRNSGTAPGYNSLSLYAHRRLSLPMPGRVAHQLSLSLAVHGDNLLANSNYSQMGSVAGSATFGRPLWAGPGRTIKVVLSID